MAPHDHQTGHPMGGGRKLNPPRIMTLPPHHQDYVHPTRPTSLRHSSYCQQDSPDQKSYQPLRKSQYPTSPSSAMEPPRSAQSSHPTLSAGSTSSANEPVYKYASAPNNEASARKENTYSLTVFQQPRQARMVGSGEKADRRPVDPPPILRFEVSHSSNKNSADMTLLRSPYFLCYCTLCEGNAPYKELYGIPHSNKPYMVGNIVTSMFQLRAGKKDKNTHIPEGHYFVFHDLGIRVEGCYRFKFSVYEIVDRKVYLCKSTMSDKFQVFPPKDFPGMNESTAMSNYMAAQGLRMRVRTKSLNVPSLNGNFECVKTGSKKPAKRKSATEGDKPGARKHHLHHHPKLPKNSLPQFYHHHPADIKPISPPEIPSSLEGHKPRFSLPSLPMMLSGFKPESSSRNPLFSTDPHSR
ncbi:hypothetical protein PGT21_023242 [Puccinia graminis f. sp. tritici]|uniref:Velvet domain-containing protein n=1 Tax=Puccinia graminis f. sp. tritici TaxID=56615 RepID=A0A5B0PYA9_PUCGR|nr:hypothetical protein PGT21_023242 [Puccinia graminis f. sp. tritici]KAA1121040.1 hypothetical protein PGTUg99_028462 [Puccinia graminis f. sp. tritici]